MSGFALDGYAEYSFLDDHVSKGGYYFTGEFDDEEKNDDAVPGASQSDTGYTEPLLGLGQSLNTGEAASKLPTTHNTAAVAQTGAPSKELTPLSSLAGDTPSPSQSNAESTRTTPVASQLRKASQRKASAEEARESHPPADYSSNNQKSKDTGGNIPHACESDERQAEPENATLNNTNTRNTAPSVGLPIVMPRPPITAPLPSDGQPPHMKEQSHSLAASSHDRHTGTPTAAQRGVRDMDAALSLPSAATTTTSGIAAPPSPASSRRCFVGGAAQRLPATLLPPPPLSPSKVSYAPMERVHGGAAEPTRLLTPARLAAKNSGLTSGLARVAGMSPTHPLSAACSPSGSSTVSHAHTAPAAPPTPTTTTAAAAAGGSSRAVQPQPPRRSSLQPGVAGRPRPRSLDTAAPAVESAPFAQLPPGNFIHSSSHANKEGNDDEGGDLGAPRPGEVPMWLAEVNNALLQHAPADKRDKTGRASAAAAVAEGNGGVMSPHEPTTLAQHRTFSQAATSSVDDWLNPCSRPKHMAATTPARPESPSSRGLPPGVTAAAHGLNLREEMSSGYTDDNDGYRGHAGSSQTSLSDTTGTAPADPLFYQAAAGEGNDNTSPHVDQRGRADGAAAAAVLQPARPIARPASQTDSLGSAGSSGGFVPISREQRTMTPPSQRTDASASNSICSNVTDGATVATQKHQHHYYPSQQQQKQTAAAAAAGGSRAPESLGRRRSSDTESAPRHLRRPDSDVSASATTAAAMRSASSSLPTDDPLSQRHPQPQQHLTQEPLTMPPLPRHFTLQQGGRTVSTDDLPFSAKPSQAALRYSPSPECGVGSASVLSTNEGPSAMRLPLARFMRNASTSSSGAGVAAAAAAAAAVASPLRPPQRTLAYPSSPSPASAAAVAGGPAVLSLHPGGPQNDGYHFYSGVAEAGRAGRRVPPSQLCQGQVQALDDAADFTLSVPPSDALSNASRATSGITLLAETAFV